MTKVKLSTLDELTFEIDGTRITSHLFRKSINAFLDVVDEVVRDISGSTRSVRWIVSVSHGSMRLHLKAESSSKRLPSDRISYVLDTIQTGFQVIEETAKRPPHFSDTALNKTRELASIINAKKRGLEAIRIGRNGQVQQVTTNTLANVDSLLGTASSDFGSVEGKLSGIFHSERYKLWIYDDVLERNITCHFPSNLLKKVLKSFEKRVSVSGLIRYRQGGEINSIEVEHFEVFPDPQTLPGFDEVLGLLRGAK